MEERREGNGSGEKLAAKSRGFFADQRIADCHSLAPSLEFVAISLQFEVLSRTERLLLDLRKGNRNYKSKQVKLQGDPSGWLKSPVNLQGRTKPWVIG